MFCHYDSAAVKTGTLPHYRINGRLLFELRALRMWLEAHRYEPVEVINVEAMTATTKGNA